MNEINLTLSLTDDEAWALAAFLRRVGWRECQENSASPEEADRARFALEEVRVRLGEAGYIQR